MSDYKDIVKHYENCFDKYGDNYKGVDWQSSESTLIRYEVMLDVICDRDNARDVSVLDFGCGTAMLCDYIAEHGYKIDYSGLPPKYYDTMLGRKVTRDIERGTALEWDMV